MRFILLGNPIPKLRPRFSKGKTYDPQKTQKNAVLSDLISQVAQCANSSDKSILEEINDIIGASAFDMRIEFHCQSTKSDLWGLNECCNKCDIDNYCKFYLDCCNTILYDDDHKIVALKAVKCYSPFPKTIIDIYPAENMQVTDQLSESQMKVLKVFTPYDMRDFLDAVGILAQYNSADLEILTKEEESQWVNEVAQIMHGFSKAWSAKLSKVAK